MIAGLFPQQRPAVLALGDGTVFQGVSLGAVGKTVGEIVFNTAMTGYQEILTDPSYARQIVTLTYPHIGNVGVNPEDQESDQIWAAGLVIREASPLVSNWRSTEDLFQYLKRNGIVAIGDIDTRRLTRHLRQYGAQGACILVSDRVDVVDSINAADSADSVDVVEAVGVDSDQMHRDKTALRAELAVKAISEARAFKGLASENLTEQVTVKAITVWDKPSVRLTPQDDMPARKKKSASKPHLVLGTPRDFHVVVYDFGVKHKILRLLVDRGCRVTVVPAHTTASAILDLEPDGIVLSNGPGDPETCDVAIREIKTLLTHNVPLMGICLGIQLLALACGAKTVKMKFGHHGANHPVQQPNGRVAITSQNHGYVVDMATLPACFKMTHRSLFDGSLQGIAHVSQPILAFQGHPEASPGPHDIQHWFDQFVEMMQTYITVKGSALESGGGLSGSSRSAVSHVSADLSSTRTLGTAQASASVGNASSNHPERHPNATQSKSSLSTIDHDPNPREQA